MRDLDPAPTRPPVPATDGAALADRVLRAVPPRAPKGPPAAPLPRTAEDAGPSAPRPPLLAPTHRPRVSGGREARFFAAGLCLGLALGGAALVLPAALARVPAVASGPPPAALAAAPVAPALRIPQAGGPPALPAAWVLPAPPGPPVLAQAARTSLPPLAMLVDTIGPRPRPAGLAAAAPRRIASAPVAASSRSRAAAPRRDPLHQLVGAIRRLVRPGPVPEWARGAGPPRDAGRGRRDRAR